MQVTAQLESYGNISLEVQIHGRFSLVIRLDEYREWNLPGDC